MAHIAFILFCFLSTVPPSPVAARSSHVCIPVVLSFDTYHLSRETFLLLPAGLSFVLSPELPTTEAKAVLCTLFVPNFLLVRNSKVLLLYLRHNLVPEQLVVAPFCILTECTVSLTFSICAFCPHTVFMYLCGFQNKQPLFPYTTLTDWFL